MSQFDFPRINFHGTAQLDTATANNGNYEPNLTMFDQDASKPYLPPRCYIPVGANFGPPNGVPILTDKDGNKYAPILPITADNYQEWATTPLGQYSADAEFLEFYTNLQMNGKLPGYWNYYGDLSVSLQDVLVTGITTPDNNGNIVTYTPQNQGNCPADLAELLGAELSFNNNYFTPGSRTTAYMSDVDSMGQMCTQIFCGTAGLYKNENGINTTFFTGTPVKSTARWMNLTRVLNYVNLVPMGGSASFYSMIRLNPDSPAAILFEKYTGKTTDCLFMKILIHEVYEVRNPDYSVMSTKEVRDSQGNIVSIKKNPAIVSITGSITPWYTGDLKTSSLCRIMKSSGAIAIDTSNIPNAIPKGSTQPIGVCPSVGLAPIHFVINPTYNVISLDLINAVTEYGINPAPLPVFAGNGDIAPYSEFVSYNFGTFVLLYTPDVGQAAVIGYITYENYYNMQQFLATGGMVDIGVANIDYTQGSFSLLLGNATVMQEEDYFATTDQQGIYAEQNQVPAFLYLSDGLPKMPFFLRVLYRGNPVSALKPVTASVQSINMVTYQSSTVQVSVFDGINYDFPVDTDGCLTYIFALSAADLFPNPPTFPGIIKFAMRASMVVLRVLSLNPELDPYLSGLQPATWDVVYQYILQLYRTLYPVMDIILPITEAVWSDPFIQSKLLMLIDENAWDKPLFMPVTRDMTAAQRQLIRLWIQQSQSLKI